MGKDLLNTDGAITNYWWDCPSCGETKISSVLHDENGHIKGATMCCPQCFYVLKGQEHSYVDETVYEIPAEWVPSLEQPRWKCQQCGGLNEKPSDRELNNLTVDDLYCQHCETWQCDIPGMPSYNPNAALERSKKVEKQSRFENPIVPVELKEDRQRFKETYQTGYYYKIVHGIKFNKVLQIFMVLFIALVVFDGFRTRSTQGFISNPIAEVNVNVRQYQIVQKQGWNPNTSAPDYDLISQSQRQDGTRQVPDGIETYWETEEYIDRYETEQYTETISEKVQTGTRTIAGECRTIKSGAVAKTLCDPDTTEPVYSTETREVTKTREVPIYATRDVKKTRQKYRTEPVYRTWYMWKQGEWVKATTLSALSNTFEIKYPDASKFQDRPDYRVESPRKKCSVLVKTAVKQLEPRMLDINCNLYETLSERDSATVMYRKWGGIKNIKFE